MLLQLNFLQFHGREKSIRSLGKVKYVYFIFCFLHSAGCCAHLRLLERVKLRTEAIIKENWEFSSNFAYVGILLTYIYIWIEARNVFLKFILALFLEWYTKHIPHVYRNSEKWHTPISILLTCRMSYIYDGIILVSLETLECFKNHLEVKENSHKRQ